MDIEEHHLKLNGNDSKSLDNEINQKYKRIEINEKEHKKEEGKTQSLFYLEYHKLIDWITRLWDNLKKNQIFIYFMIILMFLIYWIFKVNILLCSFYIISLIWNSFNIFPYISIFSLSLIYLTKFIFEKCDKVKSVMHPGIWVLAISIVLLYYVMFCHPLNNFLYKIFLKNKKAMPGICINNQDEIINFEKIINESKDDVYTNLLIVEGLISEDKTKVIEQIAEKYSNVIYFTIPIATMNYSLKLAKNLGYLQLPNLLLSYFKNGTNNEYTLLYDYLSKFKFKINSQKPVIILNKFDIIIKNNPKDANNIIDTARSLASSYSFILVGDDSLGFKTRSITNRDSLILRYPKSPVSKQILYIQCLISFKCPSVMIKKSVINEIATNSYLMNQKLVIEICNKRENITNYNEFLKIFVKSPLYFYINSQFKLLGLNLLQEPEILVKNYNKNLLLELLKIIDQDEIVYDEQIFTLNVAKNNEAIIVSVKSFNYYLSFKTRLHKIFSEIVFGKEKSEKRNHFKILLKQINDKVENNHLIR